MAVQVNNLENKDILKGSALQLFINDGGSQDVCIGFATSHALSITTNVSELSTKDHGDYPAVLPTTVTWEVTAENVYATTSMTKLLGYVKNRTKVTIKFAEVGNYSQDGGSYSYYATEPGIIENDSKTSWSIGKIIGQGKAYITSYSINAASGDNASISCTFTGCGPLDILPTNVNSLEA